MNETSIALKPTGKVGTVARGFTGHKAVDAASLAETRARFTLMCTICNHMSVQPFLPQVLLTNGRFLGKKAKVEKLRGNLSVWTQKSAWSCHATLRRYISLLGFKLKAAAPGCDYALLLDCAPSHLHGSIRQAKLNHTGGAPLWESKKLICLRPRKQDCCSDLFCQNWRSFNEPQCFCKSNRMAGCRGTRLPIEGLWPRLHVAHLCQSTILFGIVWVLLSQAFAAWRG